MYLNSGAAAAAELCYTSALSALAKRPAAPAAPAVVSTGHSSDELRLLLRLARLCYYTKSYPRGLAAADQAIALCTDSASAAAAALTPTPAADGKITPSPLESKADAAGSAPARTLMPSAAAHFLRGLFLRFE